ncbi:hypothetical protein FHG87_025513 [Trinorchestia longiramus]|nr:hypothetical protein FHG87_025513 [Trinorchestia longiramus]
MVQNNDTQNPQLWQPPTIPVAPQHAPFSSLPPTHPPRPRTLHHTRPPRYVIHYHHVNYGCDQQLCMGAVQQQQQQLCESTVQQQQQQLCESTVQQQQQLCESTVQQQQQQQQQQQLCESTLQLQQQPLIR